MRPQMVFALLTRNHRNTKEIARFAASLVRDLPVEEDGFLPNEQASDRSGPTPQVVAGFYSAQINYMLDEMRPALGAGETVAILPA